MEQNDIKMLIDSLQKIDTCVDMAATKTNSMFIRAGSLAAIKNTTQNIRVQLNKLSDDLYPELP